MLFPLNFRNSVKIVCGNREPLIWKSVSRNAESHSYQDWQRHRMYTSHRCSGAIYICEHERIYPTITELKHRRVGLFLDSPFCLWNPSGEATHSPTLQTKQKLESSSLFCNLYLFLSATCEAFIDPKESPK